MCIYILYAVLLLKSCASKEFLHDWHFPFSWVCDCDCNYVYAYAYSFTWNSVSATSVFFSVLSYYTRNIMLSLLHSPKNTSAAHIHSIWYDKWQVENCPRFYNSSILDEKKRFIFFSWRGRVCEGGRWLNEHYHYHHHQNRFFVRSNMFQLK